MQAILTIIYDIDLYHYCRAVPAFHCDTCRADVTRAANAYNHANAVESWITTLEGEAFCKNPEFGFTEEQIYECDAAIKEFVGPAMAALGQGIAGAADEICREIVSYILSW